MKIVFWTIDRERMKKQIMKHHAHKQLAKPTKNWNIVEPLSFKTLARLARYKKYLADKKTKR